MKNFDLYFFKRWSFLFSDVCLTQCSPRESYSSNWSEHFGALPRNRWRLWHRLFRLYVWLFSNLPVRKQALCAEFTTRFRLIELTFWRTPILTKWFSASTFQEIFTLLSIELPRLASASDVSFSRRSLPHVLKLVAQRVTWLFGVGFARSWLSCRKLYWSPFEHWPCSFHWTNTFSSFDATQSLSILDRCSWLDSPMPGVKVSSSKFLIYTPHHHRLQFLIIN